MASQDPCMAEALSDLNMFYIRQIGASLKKHEGLQTQLDREILIRDGAMRLVSACSHELQLLEVAKTLHASNTRTLSYMNRLQQLKASEMMEAMMDEPGYSEDSRICPGKIAISDIRIPLMWKDIHPTTKAKDQNLHAVFCLITLGSEVLDSEMVCVDKSFTDISFPNTIIFEKANYDFQMTIDIFAYPASNKAFSNQNAQLKFISKFSKISGKEEKKLKEYLKENAAKGFKSSPLFEKIGSLKLTLRDVANAVKSHDLHQTNQHRLSLPVYESITCRLVAQPRCVTNVCLSGFLHYQEIVGKSSTWFKVWCQVKAGWMKMWRNKEDRGQKPTLTIDLLPNVVKITEVEKCRLNRPHSFQIRRRSKNFDFAAEDKNKMIDWIRVLRKHKNDMGAWGVGCFEESSDRAPLIIGTQHRRRSETDFVFDSELRNTLLYKRLGAEKILSAKSNKASFVPSSTTMQHHNDAIILKKDETKSSSSEILNYIEIENNFVQKKHDADDHNHPHAPSTSAAPTKALLHRKLHKSSSIPSNETFTNTDAKTKRSKSSQNFLEYHVKNKSPKPPLPKLPPPKQKLRLRKRESSSSGSSLDGILEENSGKIAAAPSKLRPRMARHSYENIPLRVNQKWTRDAGSSSYESLKTNRSSQSSGYRSEMETEPNSDKIWVKRESYALPITSTEASGLERTQSLDNDSFSVINKSSDENKLSTASSGERIYDDPPQEYRPRTNTVPQASPKIRLAAASHWSQASQKVVPKPIPIPRKLLPNFQSPPPVTPQFEPIYDDPSSSECDLKLMETLSLSKHNQQLEDDDEIPSYLPPHLSRKKDAENEFDDYNQGPIYAQVKKPLDA